MFSDRKSDDRQPAESIDNIALLPVFQG